MNSFCERVQFKRAYLWPLVDIQLVDITDDMEVILFMYIIYQS